MTGDAEHRRLARPRAAVGRHRARRRAAADPRPDVPWSETVIQELHVRGYTLRHPDVPPEHRGTYLGLAHPAVVEHLRRIGVTAVELLPVTSIADEPPLLRARRRELLGLRDAGLPRPARRLRERRRARSASEFRAMVAALHAAGIEVILDVVPNHTAEGGVGGTTLSYRGLDAPAYYSLGGNGHDADITGTGNTLDAGSPTVIRLVCDALRHWVPAYGVDGFRIDLASVLGRPAVRPVRPGRRRCSRRSPPTRCCRACKLIAEPWDATGEGYRVGGFGVAWSEWNGRYRDAVRDFWRGHGGIGELASRLTGSSDLYAASGRRPWASVNFVTAHDGFTLRDLVSYERKHNEANGEHNRDGTDDNRSQNFGVEGDDDLAGARRATGSATARAMLATLLLSTGTPMLLGGDERWRTQGGNNNAYCRDDEHVLGGLDGHAGGRGADGVHRPGRRAAPRVARAAPRPVLPRGRGALVAPVRAPDAAATTGTTSACTRSCLLRGDWLLMLHAGDPRWPSRCRPAARSCRSWTAPARRHARRARPLARRRDDDPAARSLLLLRTP